MLNDVGVLAIDKDLNQNVCSMIHSNKKAFRNEGFFCGFDDQLSVVYTPFKFSSRSVVL